MGVRRYGNRWRGAVHFNGKPLNKYFDTYEEAEAHVLKHSRPAPFGGYKVKRFTAKAKDLPVGVIDTYYYKTLEGGLVAKYNQLVFRSKKCVNIARSYGRKRTRDQALDELIIEMKVRGIYEN